MNVSSYQYQSDESQGNSLYKQTIFQGKKSFQCSVAGCEKIFRFKSDMDRHTVVHSNEKPCVCTYPKCNRRFKRPDALKNHMQAHTEENILMCPMPDCNAQFRKKTILQYHLIKHQILNNMISDPERTDQQEIPRPFKQVHRWGEKLALQKREISAQSSLKQDEVEGSDNEESETSSNFQGDLEQQEAKEGEFFSLYPKELSELSSVKDEEEDDSTSSGTCAQDFLQSICNQLANENRNLRQQLTEKLVLIQEKYKKENEMKPSPIEEFFSFEKFENCESQDFGLNE